MKQYYYFEVTGVNAITQEVLQQGFIRTTEKRAYNAFILNLRKGNGGYINTMEWYITVRKFTMQEEYSKQEKEFRVQYLRLIRATDNRTRLCCINCMQVNVSLMQTLMRVLNAK